MKKIALKTLREKTRDQLLVQSKQLETKITKRSLELAAGKLEDVKEPSRLKADLARIKTIIREKELVAAAEAKLAAAEDKAEDKEKKETKEQA